MLVNNISPQNIGYHLFSNNITPSVTDVLSTYTELSATGYSPIYLTGSSWTVATVSNVANATYAQITYNISVATTVYGYYTTTADNTLLLFAEKFATPVVLPSSGGVITLSPSINLTFQ